MWRYVLFVLFLLAVAPLAPKLMENWRAGDAQSVADSGEAGTGSKTFEIAMARNGQYLTEARMNGRDVTMLVDTGASAIVLSEGIARDIGIFLQPSDYNKPVKTANGIAKAAPATLRDLRLGPIRLKNVDVMVLEDGLLTTPLLGMSALGRLERFHISDDTLILEQ
ncbi:TIGR02281 family clan AA aspartic protease [uncultured Roseibium sp.]|uniref:TIGR02281 family clan AA aspartic protease n=1 Tax=uncultured Roseibium sp. TaxID=1936171 RepID=UPI003216995E